MTEPEWCVFGDIFQGVLFPGIPPSFFVHCQISDPCIDALVSSFVCFCLRHYILHYLHFFVFSFFLVVRRSPIRGMAETGKVRSIGFLLFHCCLGQLKRGDDPPKRQEMSQKLTENATYHVRAHVYMAR